MYHDLVFTVQSSSAQWNACTTTLTPLLVSTVSLVSLHVSNPAAPSWRPGTSCTTPSASCATTAASTSSRGATFSSRTICTARPTPRRASSPPRATTLLQCTPTPRWSWSDTAMWSWSFCERMGSAEYPVAQINPGSVAQECRFWISYNLWEKSFCYVSVIRYQHFYDDRPNKCYVHWACWNVLRIRLGSKD